MCGELAFHFSKILKISLVPQRHDRIQPCRLERREIAEDHPHQSREEKGDQDDLAVEDERHAEHGREPQRSSQGQSDTDQAAEGGEDHRLHQELGEEGGPRAAAVRFFQLTNCICVEYT